MQYSDKMVVYQSLDDMLRALALMENDLCPPTSPGVDSRRRRVGVYRSGK